MDSSMSYFQGFGMVCPSGYIFCTIRQRVCINEAHSNFKQQIKFQKKQINEGLNLIISFCWKKKLRG